MFLSLQRHKLVLIHDVGHLHGGGRSSGLHDTGSNTGVMPTSVASYPYWSGSGLVTAGVGACNHIVHCRYARFMCSCIVDEQHTSWLKSSSFLELWYCSHRYSSKVEQSIFFHPDTRNCLSSVVTILLLYVITVQGSNLQFSSRETCIRSSFDIVYSLLEAFNNSKL